MLEEGRIFSGVLQDLEQPLAPPFVGCWCAELSANVPIHRNRLEGLLWEDPSRSGLLSGEVEQVECEEGTECGEKRE